MVGLNERFGWSIQRSRTIIELSALAVGAAFGGSIGIGTLIFALGIGPLAQRVLPPLRLPPLARATPDTANLGRFVQRCAARTSKLPVAGAVAVGQ